jgi:hypothetical protein
MKKLLFFITAVLTALSFSACSSSAPVPPGEGNAWAHNNDGTFEINIFTDKQDYKEGEPVICHATVEYVGEGEGVTIYSSDPLVYFTLKGGKYFNGDYMVSLVCITTQFKKGKPVTYEFQKSGGWGSDDPNADFYEQFYSEKQLILPPGDYIITTTLNGSLDKEESSEYSLSAALSIRVE